MEIPETFVRTKFGLQCKFINCDSSESTELDELAIRWSKISRSLSLVLTSTFLSPVMKQLHNPLGTWSNPPKPGRIPNYHRDWRQLCGLSIQWCHKWQYSFVPICTQREREKEREFKSMWRSKYAFWFMYELIIYKLYACMHVSLMIRYSDHAFGKLMANWLKETSSHNRLNNIKRNLTSFDQQKF